MMRSPWFAGCLSLFFGKDNANEGRDNPSEGFALPSAVYFRCLAAKIVKGESRDKFIWLCRAASCLRRQVKEVKGESRDKFICLCRAASCLRRQVKEVKGESRDKFICLCRAASCLRRQVKEVKGGSRDKFICLCRAASCLRRQVKEVKGESKDKFIWLCRAGLVRADLRPSAPSGPCLQGLIWKQGGQDISRSPCPCAVLVRLLQVEGFFYCIYVVEFFPRKEFHFALYRRVIF